MFRKQRESAFLNHSFSSWTNHSFLVVLFWNTPSSCSRCVSEEPQKTNKQINKKTKKATVAWRTPRKPQSGSETHCVSEAARVSFCRRRTRRTILGVLRVRRVLLLWNAPVFWEGLFSAKETTPCYLLVANQSFCLTTDNPQLATHNSQLTTHN